MHLGFQRNTVGPILLKSKTVLGNQQYAKRMGMKRLKPIGAELYRRLEAARIPGSENRITSQNLREWACDYLGRRDEEFGGNSAQARRPHWDLWMKDGDLENALFAVLLFRPTEVEFFCGTGDSYQVRHFCEHDAPKSPDHLFERMQQRFRISRRPWRISRTKAKQWLGRDW
jgi:hypothetical protein